MAARFEIVPGVGIGPVHFGMRRARVRALLAEHGLPLSMSDGALDWFEEGLQVEYERGTASFIGVAYSKRVHYRIAEVDPFATLARKLFERLRARWGNARQKYDPDEMLLRRGVITLYEADSQYGGPKAPRGPIWGQIGVGDVRYLRGVDAIE